MVGHVAFVAVAEIGVHVFRPLIGLGEKELARRIGVELGPDLLDDRVGLREVLVVRSFALAEIGDGVQAEAVDPEIQPAPHRLHDGQEHARIVVIEVRLMREETVPVIGFRHRIPGPIGFFRIVEDDAGTGITLIRVAPDIPVAGGGAGLGSACTLEPGMLIGGVVDHELGDDAELSALGFQHEAAKVRHRAEIGIDVVIVRNVIAVVSSGRRIERQEPQRRDTEILQIIQLFRQSGEIADAVAVAVEKRLDVQLIDDRVLEPKLVALELGFSLDLGDHVHGKSFTRSNETAGRDPVPDRCAGARRPIRACVARR
jgi:hypothetical protein